MLPITPIVRELEDPSVPGRDAIDKVASVSSRILVFFLSFLSVLASAALVTTVWVVYKFVFLFF